MGPIPAGDTPASVAAFAIAGGLVAYLAARRALAVDKGGLFRRWAARIVFTTIVLSSLGLVLGLVGLGGNLTITGGESTLDAVARDAYFGAVLGIPYAIVTLLSGTIAMRALDDSSTPRGFDAIERVIAMSMIATAVIAVIGLVEARFVTVLAIATILASSAFVLVQRARMCRWIKRVRTGKEPAWRILDDPPRSHFPPDLPQLVSHGMAGPDLLVHVDAEPSPYRSSAEGTPIARL